MSEAPESTPVSQEAPSAPEQQTSESTFNVPEDYQDRGWAKTIKSEEDLWKNFDNAQSLLGKKHTPPDADAPQEEWDNFYKAIGRPETPDKYELSSEFEGLPEDIPLDQYKSQAQELAHKIGLSPKQANDLWNGYMEMELESVKGMQDKQAEREAALDKEYDELGNSLFGDSFKDVSEQAQKYLGEVLPDELKGVVDSMGDNPKALLALVKVANHSQTEVKNIKKQYGAEDNLASGEQSAGVSKQEVINQLNAAKKKYSDAPVFSQDRKEAQNEIDVIRKRLQSIVG